MTNDFSDTLDLKRPYRHLSDDYIEQDGFLFGWSESNIAYQLAWWWYTESNTPLVEALKASRPLPPGGAMLVQIKLAEVPPHE